MMRWNLIWFGVGLLTLNAMTFTFVYLLGTVDEPAWLLLGVSVGGYVNYAVNVAQALTAPEDSPPGAPTMTEATAVEIVKHVKS